MKKFLLKALLFFACVVVMDLAFGSFFSYLRAHAKGGSTANCEYIANKATDDIIILGSSRATHHYVPQIIEDSLGMTCYNCGEEGNGVVLAYGRLKMLTERYNPRLVLYEITPCYDYELREPNNKYLGYLRPYYNKKGIRKLFEDFDDEFFELKMKSSMYQNKSRLLPDIIDNIITRDNHCGFTPLYGQLDKECAHNSEHSPLPVDSLKLSYIEKVIDLCKKKDIPLLFMISPEYDYGDNMIEYEPILIICKQNSVEVCNSINASNIAQYSEFFNDISHLNNEGAVLYTQSLIPLIRRYLLYED